MTDGRMEVRDLAPSLLALADVMRDANRIVNPGSPPVTLEIRATSTGSFTVQLAMVQPDWLNRIVTVFSSGELDALANLYGLVIGGPGIGIGLFKLVATVRKRRITKRESTGTAVRLTLEDGDILEVQQLVLDMYDELGIRRSAQQVVAPLARDGIDRLDVKGSATAQEPDLSLTRDDVPSFEPPAEPDVKIHDTTTEMVLTVVGPMFDEARKWVLSDGANDFSAAIADAQFLADVDRGEAFSKGDLLRCKVNLVQWQTATGRLRLERTIEEVLEHTRRNTPFTPPLFGEEAADAEPEPPSIPRGA